jgi:hypothetical protein
VQGRDTGSGTNAGARRPAPRQASGMGDTSVKPGRDGGWHPVDLPEGYHPVPWGQACQVRPTVGRDVAPGAHRVVGLRQADGMSPTPSMQDP